MVSKKEEISRASKGYIEDYYNSAKFLTKDSTSGYGAEPEFDTNKALEAIRKDSTFTSAVTTLVDRSMQSGYTIRGKEDNQKTGLKAALKTLDKVRFKKVLRQVFYNLYTYQNCFIEIVRNGKGSVKELHLLETTLTLPLVDKHGTVLGYEQIVPDGDEPITWKPEEVVHIVLSQVTTAAWGELEIQSAYTSVLIKQYVYAFLGWLYGTNQFKGRYNIKNSNETQVKSFITFLKRSEQNLEIPEIAEGEIEYIVKRNFSDGDKIIDLVNKLDQNILSLLQTPPISVGLAGDANRSNSDAQDSSLVTRVRAVQNVVEDDCEFELFPKMDLGRITLLFNPVSKSDVAKFLENAERMVNIGFKEAVVEEYLNLEGFPVKGKLFLSDAEKKKKAEMLMPTEASGDGTKKSDDMFPSRKAKPEGEGNKKVGTGEAGTTRKEQISRGATLSWDLSTKPKVKPNFNKYPYIIEGEN